MWRSMEPVYRYRVVSRTCSQKYSPQTEKFFISLSATRPVPSSSSYFASFLVATAKGGSRGWFQGLPETTEILQCKFKYIMQITNSAILYNATLYVYIKAVVTQRIQSKPSKFLPVVWSSTV